jgi:hypothetical protein
MRYLRERARPSYILNGILDDLVSLAHTIPASEALTALGYEELSGVSTEAARALAFQCFDQGSFDAAIEADISEAAKEVVIVSALISPKRVALLLDLISDRISAGVKFTVVVPPAVENGSIPAAGHKQACGLLTRLGVNVVERRLIHMKLVCIDGEVMWYGSRNPLSEATSNSEVITRTVSAIACTAILDGFFTAPGAKRIRNQQPQVA